MNDKELLTLAAKAAGLYVTGDWEFLGHFGGLRVREDDNPGGYRWHPLTDDGDALRLAVKLNLTCRFYFGNSCAQATTPNMPIAYEDVQNSADPMAGARLAIVRAAAAMAG